MSAPEVKPTVDSRLEMLLTRDRGVLSHDEEEAIRELTAERDGLARRVAEVGTERDGAYRERAHLVALLAALYPSQLREDPEDEDHEWSIVYIDLPTGQASWHIHPRDMDLFSHVEFGTDAEWDGHSTEEKYRRIAEYTAAKAATGDGKARTR